MTKKQRAARGRPWQRKRAQVRAEEPNCWLCGEPIDFDLHYLDDFAFEVDHVIPESEGGSDERHNLRASHRKCNRERNTSEVELPRSRDW